MTLDLKYRMEQPQSHKSGYHAAPCTTAPARCPDQNNCMVLGSPEYSTTKIGDVQIFPTTLNSNCLLESWLVVLPGKFYGSIGNW